MRKGPPPPPPARARHGRHNLTCHTTTTPRLTFLQPSLPGVPCRQPSLLPRRVLALALGSTSSTVSSPPLARAWCLDFFFCPFFVPAPCLVFLAFCFCLLWCRFLPPREPPRPPLARRCGLKSADAETLPLSRIRWSSCPGERMAPCGAALQARCLWASCASVMELQHSNSPTVEGCSCAKPACWHHERCCWHSEGERISQ